jgi:hypothetical protein
MLFHIKGEYECQERKVSTLMGSQMYMKTCRSNAGNDDYARYY